MVAVKLFLGWRVHVVTVRVFFRYMSALAVRLLFLRV